MARVGGIPLIQRAVLSAVDSGAVDDVYVSTDDPSIAAAAQQAGAKVIERPEELAGDTATSEAALLHALNALQSLGTVPEVLVFIQATSPFIASSDIAKAVHRVLSGGEDVVFSAIETHAFLWEQSPGGAVGVNHEHSYRPRRQDRTPNYQETGAFYVMNVSGFIQREFRFFGHVGLQVAEHETAALEIDNPSQLEIARECAHIFDNDRHRFDIDALVMDFDGVHTDDLVSVDQTGLESVRVSRSDGMGVEMLRKIGLPMLILSKEKNPVVAARGKKLQVDVIQGIDDKAKSLTDWCNQQAISLHRVAYVGNDVNDIQCLELVGWPVVVPNSHPALAKYARVRLRAPGGRGAIREISELILASRKEN